jgi:hypothetical protein
LDFYDDLLAGKKEDVVLVGIDNSHYFLMKKDDRHGRHFENLEFYHWERNYFEYFFDLKKIRKNKSKY